MFCNTFTGWTNNSSYVEAYHRHYFTVTMGLFYAFELRLSTNFVRTHSNTPLTANITFSKLYVSKIIHKIFECSEKHLFSLI